MLDRKKEVAKFFSGFEGFHALFHAYLLLSGTPFEAFGVTATPAYNLMAVVVNGGISTALGIYAWRTSGRGAASSSAGAASTSTSGPMWLFYFLLDISGILLGVFLISLGAWTWSGRGLDAWVGPLVLLIGISALSIHAGHFFFGKDTGYFRTRRRD